MFITFETYANHMTSMHISRVIWSPYHSESCDHYRPQLFRSEAAIFIEHTARTF